MKMGRNDAMGGSGHWTPPWLPSTRLLALGLGAFEHRLGGSRSLARCQVFLPSSTRSGVRAVPGRAPLPQMLEEASRGGCPRGFFQ
jgi:hypothetical protein